MTDTDRLAGMRRLDRGFMRPWIGGPCEVWEVSYDHGSTAWVPTTIEVDPTRLQPYVEGTIDADVAPVLHRGKYIARLSAPGYMDCTEWSMHDTMKAAEEYLVEMYDDGDDDDTLTEDEA